MQKFLVVQDNHLCEVISAMSKTDMSILLNLKTNTKQYVGSE